MHIAINVFSRNIKRKEFEKKTHCIIVFVAVDDEGNTIEVPKFIPKLNRKTNGTIRYQIDGSEETNRRRNETVLIKKLLSKIEKSF